MKLEEVNFWYWLVDLLPSKLVYFCFLKVWYDAENDSELENRQAITCGKAVTTFTDKHKIEF